MLKIRLQRVGRKHDPSYRVVLIDSKLGPKSGKINEILGFYDPRKDINKLKAEEIKDWISKGAQVSDTIHNLLVGQKIISGKKINVLPKKSPIQKEESKEEIKEEIKGSDQTKEQTKEQENVEDKVEKKESAEPVATDSKEEEIKEAEQKTDDHRGKENKTEASPES